MPFVRQTQPRRLDPFTLRMLDALTLQPGQDLDWLDQRLHLGRQVLFQLVRSLQAEGLTQPSANGGWLLSSLGQQARARGEYPIAVHERHVFYFRHGELPDRPPHFLALAAHPALPWPGGAAWKFDVGQLLACLRQPVEWKQQHGFPLDVEEILTLGARSHSENHEEPATALKRTSLLAAPDWQRVVLDQPERLPAVLVRTLTADGADALAGYAVRQDGWVLDANEPVFTLNAGWQGEFPELVVEPGLEQWRQAWRSWCQPRGLPPAEIEGCRLERQEQRLRVLAPTPLLERLRAARSDALKGEAWVLAGEGRIRTAALLEIVPAR